MPSVRPRISSPSRGALRTCNLRTRFDTFADLERAVALLVRDDGRVFVPLAPGEVTEGEGLKVVFTTEDGSAAVNRVAVVASTAPERSLSGGNRGVVLRLLDWKGRKPAPPVEEPASFEERNPLAGMDTNMVALLVECTLTEANQEVGHSYDDIPCVELLGVQDDPADLEPTRRVSARVLPPLTIEWANGQREVIDDRALPVEPRPLPPARWRPAAGHVLVGVGLGAAAALAMVLAPLWMPKIFRYPLPAVIRGISDSIAALEGPEPFPRALLLAATSIPPLIPAAHAEESGGPTEEPAAAPCEVRLSSRPSRVDVWSGDRRIARTPSDRLSVPCGAELVLKRARYETAAVRAAAQPGGGVQALSVDLVRPPAHIEVTSAPEGAEVRVRGRLVASTPARLTVSRYESVSIEVRAPHFKTWRKRLYVRNPEVAVQADLVARAGSSHRRGGRSPGTPDSRRSASSPSAPRR